MPDIDGHKIALPDYPPGYNRDVMEAAYKEEHARWERAILIFDPEESRKRAAASYLEIQCRHHVPDLGHTVIVETPASLTPVTVY